MRRRTIKQLRGLAMAAALLALPCGLAAQESRGEWDMSVADLRQMVERIRAEMYSPGERIPNWDRGGANPEADLRAAGADRHFFLLHSATGDAVAILTDRPLTSLAPAAWRVADTYGSAAIRIDNPVVQFESLSPRYVIGIRAGSARRNDADCIDSLANATLYERPEMPAAAEDQDIPLLFRLVLLAAEDQTVCTRYRGNREHGYHGVAFLPDGRTLPRLNESEELITIIPAGPVETLVRYGGRTGA